MHNYNISGAIAAVSRSTGLGYMYTSLPVHIIDINCTGEEETIWDCPQNNLTIDDTMCDSGQDALIQCQGKACSELAIA